VDEKQFDELPGVLVAEGTVRHGLLRGLPAVGLGALVSLFSREAVARRKKKKRKKKNSRPPTATVPPPSPPPPPPLPPLCERCPKLCESRNVVLCKPRTETERCACAWTTTGKSVCVNTITIFDTGKCKATNECERDSECGAGQACILIDDTNCCPAGNSGNLCFPICTP
jgi:hypothetical protein